MKERISQLVELLNEYAYQYYVLDKPTVSDSHYDSLYDELIKLEEKSGIILDNSPSKRVGGEILTGFKTHTHLNRLYSLDKCSDYEKLKEWAKKITDKYPNASFSLEYKLDGLTIVLTFNNGQLLSASTRGDGNIGENVTEQVKTIKSVPLTINYLGLVEIQGEGIMRYSAFNKYNETASIPLKNPRNGVAGAIRNLDTSITAKRNLDIIFYNINYIENENINQNQEKIYNFLNENRLKTLPVIYSKNIDKIIENIEKVDKNELDFAIDGMVIKVNETSIREELGYTDKFPKWAIAFKFQAEEADTKLINVVWNVGRTGKLTPLAILEPVILSGATISKATLNNYGDILRKNINIGSTVFIRRSNDVIPEVLGLAKDNNGKKISKPTICPACGSELLEKGAHIFCSNTNNCPPQICAYLEYFAHKDCMDIEGLSTSTVESLFNTLNVKSPLDLYKLTATDLSKLEGFKSKKITNLLNNIERSKNVDLAHFINALGIFNVGKKLSKDLANRYLSIDALKNATQEELENTSDIGSITAQSIVEYFKNNEEFINGLKQLNINPTINTNKIDGIFSKKKCVLTGTLINYTRAKAGQIIEDLGGEVLNSISKTIDFVLVGENAGSKLTKAQSLNIKIIYENEFIELINNTKSFS